MMGLSFQNTGGFSFKYVYVDCISNSSVEMWKEEVQQGKRDRTGREDWMAEILEASREALAFGEFSPP